MTVFRFESILRLRCLELEQVQKEYARIEGRLMTELSKLDLLEKTRQQHAARMRRRQATGTAIREIGLYDAFFGSLDHQIAVQRGLLDDLKKEAEEKREALIKASQKKRIFEKLKEQEEERHREEENKRERLRNDSLAINKVARAMSVWRDHEIESVASRDGEELA